MTISFLNKRITPLQKPQTLAIAIQQNMQFVFSTRTYYLSRGYVKVRNNSYMYSCFKTDYSYTYRSKFNIWSCLFRHYWCQTKNLSKLFRITVLTLKNATHFFIFEVLLGTNFGINDPWNTKQVGWGCNNYFILWQNYKKKKNVCF